MTTILVAAVLLLSIALAGVTVAHLRYRTRDLPR
jgi:hypothetical protein